jgi:hypothetical protein
MRLSWHDLNRERFRGRDSSKRVGARLEWVISWDVEGRDGMGE